MHFRQVVLSSVNKKGKTLYLMFMYFTIYWFFI